MNCAKHAERSVAAYCRTCGKALCEACKREVRGVIYCEDCLAGRIQASLALAGPSQGARLPVSDSPHPAVAGVLAACLPFGVGQAYNGQYARGIAYLIVFIGLVWANAQGGDSTVAVVFGLALAAFYFWQLIDAVRSANCIRMGLPAPDPFGIDRLLGGTQPLVPRAGTPPPPGPGTPTPQPVPPSTGAGPERPAFERLEQGNGTSPQVPAAALILVVVGSLFLLANLGLFRWHWAGQFWPVILIVLGAWLAAGRRGETKPPHGRRTVGPVLLIVLGCTFLLQTLRVVAFRRSWPLIMIALGLVLLWQRIAPPPTVPSLHELPQPPGQQPPPETAVEPMQERQTGDGQ